MIRLPAPVEVFSGIEDNPPGRDYYLTHESVIPIGLTRLELPILLYHYIRVPPSRRTDLVGYNLSIPPRVFAAQMDWLDAHGYHTITLNDVRLYWQRVAPLPSKPVIITLDDDCRPPGLHSRVFRKD